jgi:protein-tyrosine phosphatase
MRYHELHERILIGGANDIEDAVKQEGCNVVIDLRSEAPEPSTTSKNVEYIHIPIVEDGGGNGQDDALHRAIETVVESYKVGKKVAFHCSAGRNRTGSVAIGTLLSLGRSDTIENAEKEAKRIRSEINVKTPLKESLERLFPQHK